MKAQKTCIVCGCADDDPCRVHGVPCCWVRTLETAAGEAICAACADVAEIAADPIAREWLRLVLLHAEHGDAPPLVRPIGPTRWELTTAEVVT